VEDNTKISLHRRQRSRYGQHRAIEETLSLLPIQIEMVKLEIKTPQKSQPTIQRVDSR
jgi:hypothetical protein